MPTLLLIFGTGGNQWLCECESHLFDVPSVAFQHGNAAISLFGHSGIFDWQSSREGRGEIAPLPTLPFGTRSQGERACGGVPSVLLSAPCRRCAALTVLSRLPSPRQPWPSVFGDVAEGRKKTKQPWQHRPVSQLECPYACCLIRLPSPS